MKKDENESSSIKPTYKGGSPLALEAKTTYLQNKDMLKKIPINRKQLEYEQENSLLDKKQLKKKKSLYIYKKAYRRKENNQNKKTRAFYLSF